MHELTVMDKEKEHMSQLKDVVEMKVNMAWRHCEQSNNQQSVKAKSVIEVMEVSLCVL